jgi:5-methylthioadenosine/S-adenosylhomocysteine deaminase
MPSFLRAQYLLPISDLLGRERRIEDGYVLWEDDAILEVGPFSPKVAERIVGRYGQTLEVLGGASEAPGAKDADDLVQVPGVILPGFIKAHGHDHEPPIIGLFRDEPLVRWLNGAVNPFTGFTASHREELTALFGRTPQSVAFRKARLDDLYYGITTSMVHHCNYSKYFVDDIVAAAEEAGTRMIVAIGSQDREYVEEILDTPEEAVARLDAALERHGEKDRVTTIPGPDQLFSNGPEMMTAQKAWAREHGTLLHCHSSEELNMTARFKETYGMTPVEYAHGLGILDEDTVLAHQVHTTEHDLELLQQTGTRIVHNPLANTILGSGMPPVVEMLERGIPVAISTDGSGSADNQNILAAARLASQYQKARHSRAELLPAQKVLEMVTIEPARILNQNAGSLEPGKQADMIVLSLDRPNMTPTRLCNLVENIIWASDGSEVHTVIAGGKVLRDGDSYKTLDAAGVLKDVTTLSVAYDEHRAEQAVAGA